MVLPRTQRFGILYIVFINYLITAFALAVTLGGNAFIVEICWVLSLAFFSDHHKALVEMAIIGIL